MVESTHEVIIGNTTVMKRYRSWGRGEPEREWHALSLLDHYCEGLAPKPLAFSRDNGTPVIVMSRVLGVSLGSEPLTPGQISAVAGAMNRMHNALPPDELNKLEERQWGPRELLQELKSSCEEPHGLVGPLVLDAMDAASAWLAAVSESDLMGSPSERVFTLADGNLGNFIWDGEQCRLVDFEDSGVSQVAFESADFAEHVSVWLRGLVDTDALLGALGMSASQQALLLNCRRLFAAFWLLMLLPGAPGHERNPPGSVDRQAGRLLDLLETG